MKFIASLVVDRVPGDTKCAPLWPDVVQRMVLIVVDPEDGGDPNDGNRPLLGYGIDPVRRVLVFGSQDLVADQLSAFIQAVIEGDNAVSEVGAAPRPIRISLADRTGAVVVIPDTPPPHTGPSLVTLIGLAVAKAANVEVAFAAASGPVATKGGGGGGSAKRAIALKPPRAHSARTQTAPRRVRRPATSSRRVAVGARPPRKRDR